MAPRCFLIVLLLISSGCGGKSPAAGRPQPTPAIPAAAAGAAASSPDEPDGIRYVRTAAEFQAAFYQAYRIATARVEAEAAKRQRGSWAVILDADETIVSNMTYQAERAQQGLGYTTESWKAWTARREATALPGAADFLSRVRELGGRIAIVTNRLDTECEDTAAVFTKYALVYDAMLCRKTGSPSDKNARFADVASGRSAASTLPVDVIAFVGDNILDFPAMAQSVKAKGAAGFTDFGVRFFMVPNPMYGSWQ